MVPIRARAWQNAHVQIARWVVVYSLQPLLGRVLLCRIACQHVARALPPFDAIPPAVLCSLLMHPPICPPALDCPHQAASLVARPAGQHRRGAWHCAAGAGGLLWAKRGHCAAGGELAGWRGRRSALGVWPVCRTCVLELSARDCQKVMRAALLFCITICGTLVTYCCLPSSPVPLCWLQHLLPHPSDPFTTHHTTPHHATTSCAARHSTINHHVFTNSSCKFTIVLPHAVQRQGLQAGAGQAGGPQHLGPGACAAADKVYMFANNAFACLS